MRRPRKKRLVKKISLDPLQEFTLSVQNQTQQAFLCTVVVSSYHIKKKKKKVMKDSLHLVTVREQNYI